MNASWYQQFHTLNYDIYLNQLLINKNQLQYLMTRLTCVRLHSVDNIKSIIIVQ